MKKILFISIAVSMFLTGCVSAPKEVYIGHILVSCSPNASQKQRNKAVRKLFLAKKAIDLDTVTFRQSASETSDCPSKANNPLGSGVLGWINIASARDTKQFPSNFLDTASSLRKGEVSDIVQTQYGFHIIKCYARR